MAACASSTDGDLRSPSGCAHLAPTGAGTARLAAAAPQQVLLAGTAAGAHAGIAPPKPDEVHVWHVDLLPLADSAPQLRALLAPAELAAADRLRFERDRLRFVARRAMLRTILARYLGLAPGLLRFRANERHKPELDGAAARSGIRFNASHSGDLAVYAIAVREHIGVDVEAVRPIFDAQHIAQRFFSPLEREVLSAIPAARRSLAFLHCWTRKEAFVKALGEGLHYPLHNFDVSLAPGEPAALLRVGRDLDAGRRWAMDSFYPCSGHVAALVVAGPACHVISRPWSEGAA